MHVILTGATGTVGLPVLRYVAAQPSITKVSVLSRRDFPLPAPPSPSPDGWNMGKVEIILHSDFSSYPPNTLSKLQGAQAVIWAQGVSQNDVSKEEYIRITNLYPTVAATAFKSLSPTGKFNFIHVSGEGADQTEGAYSLYGKIKGRTEKQLVEFASKPENTGFNAYNVRPGYVDPEGQPSPSRGLFKRVTVDGMLGPVLRTLAPSMVSPTSILSKVLVDLALSDGSPLPAGKGVEDGGRTVRCDGVLRLGKAYRNDKT